MTALAALRYYQQRALDITRTKNCSKISERQNTNSFVSKVHRYISCFSHHVGVIEFLLDAERWARHLDEQYEDTIFRPPLFGLPFSCKENLPVRTSAFTSLLEMSGDLTDPCRCEDTASLGAWPSTSIA